MSGPQAPARRRGILFAGHDRSYRSDKFTPASFVSQAANVRSKGLEKVDLLPKIKHKVW